MARADNPVAYAQQIAQFVRTGDDNGALNLAERALKEFPSHPLVLRAASEVYSVLNDHMKALRLAAAAVTAMPGDPGGLLHLSVCQARANREDDAVESAKRAASLVKGNAAVLASIATMLSRLDDNEAAKEIFQEALRAAPNEAQNYYNLATVQQFLGELEEAEANCDRALKLNPKLYEVHLARARLRKQTPESNHVDELEAARRMPGKVPIEHTAVCYALAKEYEDLGEYKKSFAALKEGADGYRKSIGYRVSVDTELMDRLIAKFSSKFCADAKPGFDTDLPVFVLGLPRSGTTLVERILASHSGVLSAGELPNFLMQIRRLTRDAGPQAPEIELLERAADLDPKVLGEAYMESVPGKYKKAQRFVDKLPANFLYVGHIARALPGATIIELQRHPMDVCYAIYKNLFNRIYPASYDLDDLATYYIHYRKLMEHWHAVFGDRITSVAYEDVVADQEAQSRRLLEAAGLAWEDQVLEFHKSKSASATASAAQVRSPVYSSSVQLWRRYEEELSPLAERLTAAGIDIS